MLQNKIESCIEKEIIAMVKNCFQSHVNVRKCYFLVFFLFFKLENILEKICVRHLSPESQIKTYFTSIFQQFLKLCWSHYYVIWLQMIIYCTSEYIFGFRIFKTFFDTIRMVQIVIYTMVEISTDLKVMFRHCSSVLNDFYHTNVVK